MIRTSSKWLVALAGFLIFEVGLPNAFAVEDSPVLDKQQQLDRFTWWDNRDWDWYKQRIPFFESPDADIDSTYYYRWELVTKHMTYGSPESGYSFKEFITVPFWSGSYGAISCPSSLQIYELRWLKDRRVTDDFIRYWFHTPGAQPRSYSNWYGDAVWANYLVNGDKEFVTNTLPDMEAQYEGWMKERWDADHQMFHWSGMHDGMEFTIGSRLTQDPFEGADSYRPTLNSYIYGDLTAMARTADLAGNHDKAVQFQAKAEALKGEIQDQLWDPKRNFFIGQFRNNETSQDGKYPIKAGTLIYQEGQFAGDPHGRELSGYVPWMFNLPDKGKGYEAAWKGAADPDVFLAKYGLYFTEHHDPLFKISDGSNGCWWSGNNWPYADSEVLMAMANVLDNYPQTVISKEDYFKVFKAYTQTHLAEAQPYIAEDQDPDTGRWINNDFNHSEHYFHSSYVDLLISGLVGLRPRADDVVEVNPLVPDKWDYFALDDVAYHGHKLSIIWDRDGTRYHRGKGLTILADGTPIATSATLGHLKGKLPSVVPPAPPVDRPVNFAVNNDGNYFPTIDASFTAPGTSESNLVDGTYYYHDQRPVNRWTTVGSPNASDSVEIDFGIERPIENVKLYVLDDGEGKPVRAPASIDLEFWDGSAWKAVPGQKRTPEKPAGHRPNIIEFPVLNTLRIRAVFTPQPHSAVGLTEFETWGHADLPLKEGSVSDGDLALGAKASASFTSRFDRIEEINDGKIAMRVKSRNRWTAYDSPNASDWVQFDFPTSASVGRVKIYWWANGEGVRLPKNYKIQYWINDDWADVTESKRSAKTSSMGTIDEVTIDPVQTDKLRITFEHNLPGKTGVTELMVFEK
jgi:hypothetical protein